MAAFVDGKARGCRAALVMRSVVGTARCTAVLLQSSHSWWYKVIVQSAWPTVVCSQIAQSLTQLTRKPCVHLYWPVNSSHEASLLISVTSFAFIVYRKSSIVCNIIELCVQCGTVICGGISECQTNLYHSRQLFNSLTSRSPTVRRVIVYTLVRFVTLPL